MSRNRPATATVLALFAIFSAVAEARAAEGDEPGLAAQALEEPGLAPARAPTGGGYWLPRARGTRLTLGYRTFSVGEMGGADARYHCVSIDSNLYSGYLRTGLGFEAGGYSSPRSNIVLEGTVHVGAQLPARVTPFVDVSWGGGFVRRDILNQDLYSFAHHVGVDAGADYFVTHGLALSLALGWRRQIFRHNANNDTQAVYVYYDSFSLRASIGF